MEMPYGQAGYGEGLPNVATANEDARAALEASQQKGPGLVDAFNLAREREWIVTEGSFSKEKTARNTGWEMDKDTYMRVKDQNKFEQNEMDYLSESASTEELDQRIDRLKTMRGQDEQLARLGVLGNVGVRMIAGMTDPTAWAVSGPFGAAAAAGRGAIAATRASRAVRGALGAGVSNAAVEGILTLSDPYRDASDIALAGVIGLGMGGVIGAATANSLNRGIQNPRQWAYDAEEAMRMVRADEWDFKKADAARAEQLMVETHAIDTQKAAAYAQLEALQDQLGKATGNPNALDEVWRLHQIELKKTDIAKMESDLVAHVKQMEAPAPRNLDELKAKLSEAEANLKKADSDLSANQFKLKDPELTNAKFRAQKAVDDLRAQIEAPERPKQLTLEQKNDRAIRQSKIDNAKRELEDIRNPKISEDVQIEAMNKRFLLENQIRNVQRSLRQLDEKMDNLLNPKQPEAPKVDGAEKAEPVTPPDRDGAELAALVNPEGRRGVVMANIAEAAKRAPRVWGFVQKVQGFSSELANSEFAGIRGLGHLLFSNSQINGNGMHPAAVKRDLYLSRLNQKMLPASMAENEFIRRNKLSAFNEQGMRALEEFNNQVVLAMKGIKPEGPDADLIMKSAASRADALEYGLQIRKQNEVYGFDHIENDRSYHPLLVDRVKLRDAVSRFGEDEVKTLIQKMYSSSEKMKKIKDPALRDRISSIIADAVYARETSAPVNGRPKAVLSEESRKFLMENAEKAGFPKENFELWIKSMDDADADSVMSNRAKHAMGADMTATHKGIRAVDLLDTKLDATHRYSIEASADAALGSVGFRSPGEVEMAVNVIRNEGIKGADGKSFNEANKKLSHEADLIDMGMKQLYGQTIAPTNADGSVREWVRWGRMGRQISSAISLSWNGLASIPELGNSMAKQGVWSTLKHIPRLKINPARFKDPADPLLQGWMDMTGLYGHLDGYFQGSRRGAELMAESGERISRLESGIRSVGEVQSLLSGFKHIQHGVEDLAMRAMVGNLERAATTGKRLPKIRQQFISAGMSGEDFDTVIKHMKENRTTKSWNGNDYDIADLDSIPVALRDKFGAAMLTQLGQSVQRQFIGETPEVLSKELGKTLFQFMTFPVVAMEKQLINGVRGDRAAFAAALTYQAGIAYGAYNALVWGRSQMSEDPEAYRKEALTTRAVMLGTVNRMGMTSMFELGSNALATMNMLPDEMMARPGSPGAQSMVRAPGMVSMVPRVTRAARDTVQGAWSGDDEALTRGLYGLRRVTPILNSAAFGFSQGIINEAMK